MAVPRALLVAAAAAGAAANMNDVIEPHKVPPAACAGGCAAWADQGPSLWAAGAVPDEAANHCAQPGKVVNAHPYGSWCYCADGGGEGDGSKALPVANRTFQFQNVGSGPSDPAAGMWVSFDSTTVDLYAKDVDPGDRGVWLMVPVPGASDTYYIMNEWRCPDEGRCGDWLSFTGTNVLLYAQDDLSGRAPWKLVPAGDDKFSLQNLWNGPSERRYGMYIGTSGGGKDLVLVAANDTANRGTYEFVPAAKPRMAGYCTSASGVPEQVNVQLASPDTVIVSWVTFEPAAPAAPPTLYIGKEGAKPAPVHGVTHVHKTAAGDRTYYMHFVRASGLAPRARYSYKVQSGGTGAAVSDTLTFRAPYASGETRINIYGDMGVYETNNMQQLYDDCVRDESIDAIVHMGDHAYNEGDEDERRADGYFSAFQQTISNCPWMPVVGNHEYYAGAKLGRYLDSTWDKWGPIAGGDVPGNEFATGPAKSTATSALGALLTTANHHGAGTLGANPSGTSRYFSSDFGLLHLVALDLNLYFGVDPCGDSCRKEQLAWLEQDLAAANTNRDKVPWVLAFSHYPLYCTGCMTNQVSGEYYASDAAERWGNGNATASALWEAAQPRRRKDHHRHGGVGVEGNSNAIIADFRPLFDKYSVDLYLGGHWHYYESLWPATQGPDSCLTCAKPTQKDFASPNVTVHVTTGNGGPGGIDTFCESGKGAVDCGSIPATRKQSTEYGYGRVTAHNSTHLTFQQFLNKDSSLLDEWTIVQPKHPFNA